MNHRIDSNTLVTSLLNSILLSVLCHLCPLSLTRIPSPTGDNGMFYLFISLSARESSNSDQTCHDPVLGIWYRTQYPPRFLGLQYPPSPSDNVCNTSPSKDKIWCEYDLKYNFLFVQNRNLENFRLRRAPYRESP